MQFIDQEKLWTINVMLTLGGEVRNCYALSPLSKGDIIYKVDPCLTALWRVETTEYSKLSQGIIIGGTDAKPRMARYWINAHLRDITGPERDELLEDLVALDALPY